MKKRITENLNAKPRSQPIKMSSSNQNQNAIQSTKKSGGGNPKPKNTQKSRPKFSETAKIPIDEEYVGFVLGKQGQTVNQIQRITKTKISHLEPNLEKGFPKHGFWIGGHNSFNVYMARVTIEDLIQTAQSKEEKNSK